ncbi:uncharacterized protein LOC103175080 [Callorhinchus milii]|uniref:uncharacterized protein LOC103175080 n=1 Tax=Callorhinchus milii TaxID=7868 RepID=UPI0004575B8C|nr:uncharacterized protein LOC103175080 [Callorhinchus milii]|eukprot:gi/632941752/ref/XP_007886034.1/ PREDICTED: uncharacterized protein LOC103175080 [Callorhinchus milii]
MEPLEKWHRDLLALKLLDKKLNSKNNGTTGMVAKHLQQTFKTSDCPQSSIRSECGTGSCPDLAMNRDERLEYKLVTMTSTPKLPVRSHRPLCLSVSSDGNGRYKPLECQEFNSSLKSQMEQAYTAGAASSTGALERASLFCASGSNTLSLSGSSETLTKTKSSSRFSLFSAPWNSSSESDSNPPSRSGSRKSRNHSRKVSAKTESGADRKQGAPVQTPTQAPAPAPTLQYSEPVIARVTDCIYVGNLNAGYSGRTLCRNSIDSIIDVSNLPGELNICLIPCTCSRSVRHSWSRLKVDTNWDTFPLKRQCFEDINECINASAGKGKRVLVHCRDGYSLAPTCVIQYLMQKQDMRLINAYELLKAKYPLNIKDCHQDLLVTLEQSLRPGDTHPDCFKQAISRKTAWT